MKDQQVKFKVSPEEKLLIEQAAQMYGGSLSDYIRKKLLSDGEDLLDGKSKQEMMAALCKLCRLTEKIAEEDLQKNIKNVEMEIWQCIK